MENYNETITLFVDIIQKININYWYFILYWGILFLTVYSLIYITESKDKKGYLVGYYGQKLFINIFVFIMTLLFATTSKEFGGFTTNNSINYFVENIITISPDIIIISVKYICLAFIISKIVKSPDGGGSSISPLIVITFFYVIYYGNILDNLKNHENIDYLEIILLILAINLGFTERNAIDRFGAIDEPYNENKTSHKSN